MASRARASVWNTGRKKPLQRTRIARGLAVHFFDRLSRRGRIDRARSDYVQHAGVHGLMDA
jgi:hypothetical protein